MKWGQALRRSSSRRRKQSLPQRDWWKWRIHLNRLWSRLRVRETIQRFFTMWLQDKRIWWPRRTLEKWLSSSSKIDQQEFCLLSSNPWKQKFMTKRPKNSEKPTTTSLSSLKWSRPAPTTTLPPKSPIKLPSNLKDCTLWRPSRRSSSRQTPFKRCLLPD